MVWPLATRADDLSSGGITGRDDSAESEATYLGGNPRPDLGYLAGPKRLLTLSDLPHYHSKVLF